MADESAEAKLLRRLRDEVYDCYCASPASEIRHAMLLRVGSPLPDEKAEKWWNGIGAFIRASGGPIGPVRQESIRLDLYGDNPTVGSPRLYEIPSHRYLGRISDPGELHRWRGQAERIAYPALLCLRDKGIQYGSLHPTEITWVTLCYFLAWDQPWFVTYWPESRGWLESNDPTVLGLSGGFIRDRIRFAEWESRKTDLPDGTYFVSLSTDVRAATVSAIDLILDMPIEGPTRQLATRGARAKQAIPSREKGDTNPIPPARQTTPMSQTRCAMLIYGPPERAAKKKIQRDLKYGLITAYHIGGYKYIFDIYSVNEKVRHKLPLAEDKSAPD